MTSQRELEALLVRQRPPAHVRRALEPIGDHDAVAEFAVMEAVIAGGGRNPYTARD